jgi:2-polyprenyl-6-hydroxyphenyl methylase/3-demethylubiquinone-9 3-methyltransferase
MNEARFEFGDNWKRYAAHIDETKINESIRGLSTLISPDTIRGCTFLDIGSGSGLHSLAAYRIGAKSIISFDYDANSAECTQAVREKEGSPPNWTVLRGSVLDPEFMSTLSRADIVYSWGVLHHTGQMWEAIRQASRQCAGPGSILCIGIYNRKPVISKLIKGIKFTYVKSPKPVKSIIKWLYWATTILYRLARRKPIVEDIRSYHTKRGMDYWRDLEDWVGGYPFECATAAEIVSFVLPLGFDLIKINPAQSYAGVSEYVFRANAQFRS